jgi:hypothetical protein
LASGAPNVTAPPIDADETKTLATMRAESVDTLREATLCANTSVATHVSHLLSLTFLSGSGPEAVIVGKLRDDDLFPAVSKPSLRAWLAP